MRSRRVAAILCCVAVSCSGPGGPDPTSNNQMTESLATGPTSQNSHESTSLHAAAVEAAEPIEVPLEDDGGTFVVPVTINGAISLKFTIDSGASDVTIPSDVASTLVRAGTISQGDYIGSKTFVLADGSTIPSPEFRIRSLRVGNLVLHDVVASITGPNGSLLLGQTFLTRLKHWSIDNDRHMLVLAARDDATPQIATADILPAVDDTAAEAAYAVSPEVEASARQAVGRFFAAWSNPDDPDGQAMRGFYAASVNFYGKQMSVEQVMQEKLRFARRWPMRSYAVEPDSFHISCSESDTCTVFGTLDWNAANSGGVRKSSGTARFSLSYKGGHIIEEHGRVLSRAGSD